MENCANSNIRSDNKKLYLPDLSKDVQANANVSILSNCFDKKNDENVIPIRTLVGYNTIGFKVTLGADLRLLLSKQPQRYMMSVLTGLRR